MTIVKETVTDTHIVEKPGSAGGGGGGSGGSLGGAPGGQTISKKEADAKSGMKFLYGILLGCLVATLLFLALLGLLMATKFLHWGKKDGNVDPDPTTQSPVVTTPVVTSEAAPPASRGFWRQIITERPTRRRTTLPYTGDGPIPTDPAHWWGPPNLDTGYPEVVTGPLNTGAWWRQIVTGRRTKRRRTIPFTGDGPLPTGQNWWWDPPIIDTGYPEVVTGPLNTGMWWRQIVTGRRTKRRRTIPFTGDGPLPTGQNWWWGPPDIDTGYPEVVTGPLNTGMWWRQIVTGRRTKRRRTIPFTGDGPLPTGQNWWWGPPVIDTAEPGLDTGFPDLNTGPDPNTGPWWRRRREATPPLASIGATSAPRTPKKKVAAGRDGPFGP